GADDRVSADADGGREAEVTQLVHHLVGQRAGLRDEAQLALLRDVGRDDAGQRLTGGDDARAVGSDDAGGVAGRLRTGPDLGRILNRDAFGDDDEQTDTCIDGLDRGVLG